MVDKTRFVIDASITIKWLHKEDKTETALQLLDQINSGEVIALVPNLIIYEIANTLIRGIKRPLLEANKAIDSLAVIPWQIIAPTPDLIKDAMQFAAEHSQLSLYDAAYIAVALHHNASVITADQKLHKKVGQPLTQLLQ